MDVLVHLAANPGKVVPKEELLEAGWSGAFVEEGALSQAIHAIRKALGDDARQPRFIQTVPKRGYRLVAVVEEIVEAVPDPLPESAPTVSPIPALWSRRARPLMAVASIVVALALWIAWDHRGAERQDGGIRIVVLPFENLGKPQDPDFAAGLTEEITANLTRIPAIAVIPGRNALGDKGVAKPLPEIDGELKVDYVLRGKVSWQAGPSQVRVIPQLIRMADKTLVPIDSFEGSRDDLFKAQQEITRQLISTLDITLTPEQGLAVGQRSTESPEAYRAFVRGRVLKDQPFYSPPHLEKAALMFQQAVGIDPGFAEAWAELSQVHSYLAFNTDPSPARMEKAREALRHARDLDPDLPTVRLAQIYFNYRCLGDFDAALDQVDAALQHWPHDAELTKMLGLALMRKGRLTEALAVLRRASALDPRSRELPWIIADIHRARREYETADQEYSRAISLAPDVPFFWERRALNRLCWTGNPKKARAILAEAPMPETTPQLQLVATLLDFYEGNYRSALARISADSIQALPLQDQSRFAVLGVIALERLGDHEGAMAAAEMNRSELESRMARYPRESIYRAYYALTLAQLGRREEALEQVAEAARRSEKDAFSGPQIVEVQAMVDVALGRHTGAVARLDQLLETPYRAAICRAEVRMSPVWEPLRGEPAFEALIRQLEE